MKVLVVASNGRVGKLVVKNALKKGFDVTGSGKGENLSEAGNYIQKNALDLTKEEVSGFDAVIDCAGGWDKKTINNIPNVMIHLANILEGTKTSSSIRREPSRSIWERISRIPGSPFPVHMEKVLPI